MEGDSHKSVDRSLEGPSYYYFDLVALRRVCGEMNSQNLITELTGTSGKDPDNFNVLRSRREHRLPQRRNFDRIPTSFRISPNASTKQQAHETATLANEKHFIHKPSQLISRPRLFG